MSRSRLIFIHVLIVSVIGGSLYDIVTRQEHWPFFELPDVLDDSPGSRASLAADL